MTVKLILDDTRTFPDNIFYNIVDTSADNINLRRNGYNCVRTYDDCILLLKLFDKLDFISLDYHLGTDKTGLDVLIFMAVNNITTKHINIHSDHERGVPMMEEYVAKHFPDVRLTKNKIKL